MFSLLVLMLLAVLAVDQEACNSCVWEERFVCPASAWTKLAVCQMWMLDIWMDRFSAIVINTAADVMASAGSAIFLVR